MVERKVQEAHEGELSHIEQDAFSALGIEVSPVPEAADEALSQERLENLAQMAQDGIHAGFPSPAQDYMSPFIDLNKELVRHPLSTFYGRVVGDSMIDAGIQEGDILVIDKSLEPTEGAMAVCFIDGEFTLKYISFQDPKDPSKVESPSPRKSYDILHTKDIWLLPANKKYPPIHVEEGNDFTVWGIVTYVIKKI